MRRLIGSFLVLHALAHAGAGIWVYGVNEAWPVTVLWFIATLGFLAAGIGLIGVPLLDRHWRAVAVTAAVASLALVALYVHPVSIVGSAIDAAVLIGSIPFVRELVPRWIGAPAHPARRRLRPLGAAIALLLAAYPSALIMLRPWYTHWGVSLAERASTMPGDELVAEPGYRIDHGLTVQAPAAAVWPWLVQIGQDRGGFYSYDWLERLVGDPVHNVDRIVPEWQSLKRGDLVRAAPPNYLGGALGKDLGWRVAAIVPERALVLDGWGAFVLESVNDTTTRLLARTRGEGRPSFVAVPLAPLGMLLFEPAHFVMERRMLVGIKERAEREWNRQRTMSDR
jgi:hypothetical protein